MRYDRLQQQHRLMSVILSDWKVHRTVGQQEAAADRTMSEETGLITALAVAAGTEDCNGMDWHGIADRNYNNNNNNKVVLVMQRFGVGLVIERSLVRLPAGALSSQLGQLSLPSLWGR